MALTKGWLLDKSALARWHQPSVAAALEPSMRARQLFTCAVIELEVLYSARTPADYVQIAADRRRAYEWAEMDTDTWSRAISMQGELAAKSHVRAVGIADILIAATAQQHDLAVLHYDRNFEALGRLCGVRQQAVVPLGSLP